MKAATKTLIEARNAETNFPITHILEGDDFTTLYALTDFCCYVVVYREGEQPQELVISVENFQAAIGRNTPESEFNILPVNETEESKTEAVDCLATEEQKETLTTIIEKCDTKPQHFNKCRKCDGTGEWKGSQGRTGSCFNCGKHKKGHNPNKWLQIKLEAQALLKQYSAPLSEEQIRDFKTYNHLRPMFESNLTNNIVKLTNKTSL